MRGKVACVVRGGVRGSFRCGGACTCYTGKHSQSPPMCVCGGEVWDACVYMRKRSRILPMRGGAGRIGGGRESVRGFLRCRGDKGARECVWRRSYLPRQERKETNERPTMVGGVARGGGGMPPSGKRCVSGIKRERAAACGVRRLLWRWWRGPSWKRGRGCEPVWSERW